MACNTLINSTILHRVGIRNISDYSPFGVLLKERTIETANFRYGFQGQESDDEVKGEGNSINYKYRMHDPRIGRFFAVDPLEMNFPHNSPYAFSENRVIDAVEMEGLELVLVHGTWAARNDRPTGMLKKADYKGGSTWKKELGEGIAKATGWSEDQTFEYSWTGTNRAWNRKEAAKTLASKLMDSEINPDADKKHVTLVGHSHGGNVNKEVQKILIKKGWTVDIINISTPQRDDHQSTSDAKSNGVYLNFYSNGDAVQWAGTDDNLVWRDEPNVGPWGPRKDQNADRNISVGSTANNSLKEWGGSFAGHSYHQDLDAIQFIINKVEDAFKKEAVQQSSTP